MNLHGFLQRSFGEHVNSWIPKHTNTLNSYYY